MYSARKLATAVAATLTVASFASLAQGSAETVPPVGRGGAGAFIRPAHVNGPFGAGGPLAGVGGAGAFIPATVRDPVARWEWCAFADHLAAADLGPLLSATLPVSPEVQAVLLGEVTVGTDCSAYDVPV
jgi:hypothetical protein